MDVSFNKNEDFNKLAVSELKRKLAEVSLGGGVGKMEKEHAKGKLTARERIQLLIDPKTDPCEIGALREMVNTRNTAGAHLAEWLW